MRKRLLLAVLLAAISMLLVVGCAAGAQSPGAGASGSAAAASSAASTSAGITTFKGGIDDQKAIARRGDAERGPLLDRRAHRGPQGRKLDNAFVGVVLAHFPGSAVIEAHPLK